MSLSNYKFAVFILTHGRPNNIKTVKTLEKHGYTGPVYYIIDNEDKTAEEYYKNFGRDHVIMFDKKAIADTTDEGDNFDDRRTTTHTRNASFEIAKNLGLEYFIQLDDDYLDFSYKFDDRGEWAKYSPVMDLDAIFEIHLKYLISTNVLSVALAQSGDFMGGAESAMAKKIKPKRKAMNSFICAVNRPFKFVGRMNEDVNTYVTIGRRGGLFLTITLVSLQQLPTQSNTSGMTNVYLDYGTYVKSFYTVMYEPSCVSIMMMGYINRRIHHRISWKHAVPKILSPELKKSKK